MNERVIVDASDEMRELFNQSRYGTVLESGKLQLSLLEGLYLIEKNKMDLKDSRNKKMDFELFLNTCNKTRAKFLDKILRI